MTLSDAAIGKIPKPKEECVNARGDRVDLGGRKNKMGQSVASRTGGRSAVIFFLSRFKTRRYKQVGLIIAMLDIIIIPLQHCRTAVHEL